MLSFGGENSSSFLRQTNRQSDTCQEAADDRRVGSVASRAILAAVRKKLSLNITPSGASALRQCGLIEAGEETDPSALGNRIFLILAPRHDEPLVDEGGRGALAEVSRLGHVRGWNALK